MLPVPGGELREVGMTDTMTFAGFDFPQTIAMLPRGR